MAKKKILIQQGATETLFPSSPTQATFPLIPVEPFSERSGPGQAQSPAFAEGEVLVRFNAQESNAAREKGIATAISAVGGEILEVIEGGLENSDAPVLVRMKVSVGTERAIDVLSNLQVIDYAEHNWKYTTQATSNDSFYTGGNLWGMYGPGDPKVGTGTFGSKADEAWFAGHTGSSKTVVGIIDEGVDYRHPDLYLNIWLNQGEIPTSLRSSLKDTDGDRLITFRDLNHADNSANVSDVNGNGRIDAGDLLNDPRWENGINEDGNKSGSVELVDDLVGWDFVGKDNDPYNVSVSNHGTHVSGTIGGIGGNAIGVAGVSWSTQMMLLPFLGSGGGYTSDAVSALNYYTWASGSTANAAANFFATSNSWGGGGYSTALYNAIVALAKAGNLFVAAAGNSGVNTDSTANYPSTYSTLSAAGYEAVIAVGSITSSGARSSFSNYGDRTVDLFAPGSGVISTVADGTYASYSGTSMATPHVSGALALLASALTQGAMSEVDYAKKLLEILQSSVAPVSGLSSISAWDGILDAASMLGKVSATIAPNIPAEGSPEISGAFIEDQTLTALSGSIIDNNGFAAAAISWKWQRSSDNAIWTDIAGATSGSYQLGDNDVNQYVRVLASFIDGAGYFEQRLSASSGKIANVNDSPQGSVAIGGNAAVGQVLTATHNLTDADGLGTISFKWFASGSAVLLGQGTTYQVNEKDTGSSIYVRAEYTDGYGTLEGISSASTSAVVSAVSSITFIGTTGADTFVGGSGNDSIYGKDGNDTLGGGDGSDGFYFDTRPGSTNFDKVTDFQSNADKIVLAKSVFSKLTVGTLGSGNFQIGTGGKAVDKNDFVLYDDTNGSLYYDPDGSGKAAAIKFAEITGGLQLAASDFLVI